MESYSKIKVHKYFIEEYVHDNQCVRIKKYVMQNTHSLLLFYMHLVYVSQLLILENCFLSSDEYS